MSEKDSQTGWTETRAKGRTEGGGGRRDTACWPLGLAEEPVRAASSQLLEFSSRRLGQGFQSELPAGLFSSPLAHPVSSILADASLPWKIPGSGEGSGFQLLLCIHHFGGLRHAPSPPLPRPFLFIITTRSLFIAHLNILVLWYFGYLFAWESPARSAPSEWDSRGLHKMALGKSDQ